MNDTQESGWCDGGLLAAGQSSHCGLGLLGLQEAWCLLKSNKNVYECVLFLFLEITSKV